MAQAPKRKDLEPAGTFAFEGGTGYLLSRAGSLARRSWARMLADRDLTAHHYGMLMALREFGSTGQNRLSVSIGIDPRNAVPIVDGLVERGLLARELDATDRRRRSLTLTTSGRAMVRDLIKSGADMERYFLRALAPAEQQTLHKMLLTLLASVAEDDP